MDSLTIECMKKWMTLMNVEAIKLQINGTFNSLKNAPAASLRF